MQSLNQSVVEKLPVKFQWPAKAQLNPRLALLANHLVSLYSRTSSNRKPVEAFIQQQFALHYGAEVTEFMPHLMALESAEEIGSGLGISVAGPSRLFIEQYMTSSIEDKIHQECGLSVNRDSLVEIGNLASSRRGITQLMFVALTAYLERINIDWVACNATKLVQNNFSRLGFQYYRVCTADKHRLKNGFEHWGSYYDTPSEVTLINVHQAYTCLKTNPRLLTQLMSIKSYCDYLPDIKSVA